MNSTAAFNRQGELFAYDADMEWDLNTPWYRPDLFESVISGAEFGWPLARVSRAGLLQNR